MRYINVFYIAVLLIGLILWKINSSYQNDIELFYGFAENKETEINFNYPTAVGKIYVTPGQMVKKGEPLLDLFRIKSKEVMDDQQFKLDELDSRNDLWRTERQSDLRILQTDKKLELMLIGAEIRKLKEQRDFQKSLYENLKSVDTSSAVYTPITSKILDLENERLTIENSFDEKIDKIKSEINLASNTFQIQKRRLLAEGIFEEENKIIHNQLVAPSDGIVGTIHCKEDEHIPSFKTLITFYDPNPNLVKGYVHEDLIVHVTLEDSFVIRSKKDENIACMGKVIGLGSRIVEIPERLRKIPEYKTYGREVLVSIPDNDFLQKEKVVLHFINPPVGWFEPVRKKSLVDFTEKDMKK